MLHKSMNILRPKNHSFLMVFTFLWMSSTLILSSCNNSGNNSEDKPNTTAPQSPNLNSNLNSLPNTALFTDGTAVPQYYTRFYDRHGPAYSDHAPIYFNSNPNDQPGTWNITQKAGPLFAYENNTYNVRYNEQGHVIYNHKFDPLSLGENLLATPPHYAAETPQQYADRIRNIVNAIRDLISRGIHPLVLQELPYSTASQPPNLDRYELGEALNAQGLTITADHAQGIVTRQAPQTNIQTIAPLHNTHHILEILQLPSVRHLPGFNEDNFRYALRKMSAFYLESNSTLYINIHARMFSDAGQTLCLLLRERSIRAKRYFASVYPINSVKILGDFNASASDIQQACQAVGLDQIHTTPQEESYSAGTGGNNPQNIDLMIELRPEF